MAGEHRPWTRRGEAFWRAHHGPWKRSDLNQREYCELHGLPQKGFENWRVKFKAEPQAPERKLLYRRGGLSHRLSHIGHSPSHMTNDPLSRPTVPPARNGHRRAFGMCSPRPRSSPTTRRSPYLIPGRGRTKTGRLWVYTRDDRPWAGPDPPAAVYFYSPDRKAERRDLFSPAICR
jgi:hypothetical protein